MAKRVELSFMNKSYSKIYAKIYLFKTLSVILGMLSLFVVMPHLTSNKYLFGIYSICSSLSIYFSYADLGFVGAGQKFAAENYSSGDDTMEKRIIGFIAALLFVFLFLISSVIFIFSLNPSFLIKDIAIEQDIRIAHYLLLILSLSFPIFALHRILDMIFSIRMEDYRMQIFIISGNIIKILSVFYFFREGKYMIVEYFLFIQIITLLCCLIGAIYANQHYGYNIGFIKYIKFDNRIFRLLKNMAFASLISMICWIVLYELDQVTIAKMFGATEVAIYAIAFSILSLVRTYNSILYSPFTPRMNYFLGENDREGLDKFTRNLIINLFPLQTFPILVICMMAEAFIISWTGRDYSESVILTQCVVFTFFMVFISNPCSIYIQALEKNTKTVGAALVSAICFWGGIMVLNKHMGVLSFAIMKPIACAISSIYLLHVTSSLMSVKEIKILMPIAKYYSIGVFVCIFLGNKLNVFVLSAFNGNLFAVLIGMAIVLIISLLVAYLFNPYISSKGTGFICDLFNKESASKKS